MNPHVAEHESTTKKDTNQRLYDTKIDKIKHNLFYTKLHTAQKSQEIRVKD